MMSVNNSSLDRYRGCLIGGAVGDALGYAVEFIDESAIRARYGERGITAYDLSRGTAVISDDTQMTLFTANGLLMARGAELAGGLSGKYADYMGACYKDWYITQYERFPSSICYGSWLMEVPELFVPRAPGNTCLSALSLYIDGVVGTPECPINDSKGCGGVMRAAPVGLYFGCTDIGIDVSDKVAAEAAALTHGNDLGYIPAAALAHIIYLLSGGGDITLEDAVEDMIGAMSILFDGAPDIGYFTELMRRAVKLAHADIKDIDAIHALGEGWVGEEALAIGVYCAIRYRNDLEAALIAAVNHKGDSDSTGSITGNILGAYLGMSEIPEKFLRDLELRDIIVELADDLWLAGHADEGELLADETWVKKYIEVTLRS